MRPVVVLIVRVALLLLTLLGAAWHAEAGLVLRTGDLLVANGIGGDILKIDPLTGAQEVISSGGSLSRPLGIAVGPDGRIFAVDEDYPNGVANGALFEIDPVTGAQSIISLNFNRGPSGIAIDDEYNLYVSEQLVNDRTVRIEPATGAVTAAYGGPSQFNRPMLPAVQGTTLIVPNRGRPGRSEGTVYRVDLTTGQASLIASLNEPHAAAIEADGNYLIADAQTLYRIDKGTLGLSVLASGFGSLTGLAIEADGSIITADRGTTKRLWRVDPVTGDAVVLSSGGLLDEPFQVAVYMAAVPEPSTLTMGLIGITAAVGFLLRRN